MPIRPSTAIGKALDTTILVALEDLVTGLAGDIELAAEDGHLLAFEQPRYEPKSLIHLVTLLPRHFALP